MLCCHIKARNEFPIIHKGLVNRGSKQMLIESYIRIMLLLYSSRVKRREKKSLTTNLQSSRFRSFITNFSCSLYTYIKSQAPQITVSPSTTKSKNKHRTFTLSTLGYNKVTQQYCLAVYRERWRGRKMIGSISTTREQQNTITNHIYT